MLRASTGRLTGNTRHRCIPLRGEITRQVAACAIARMVVLASESHDLPIVVQMDSPEVTVKESLRMLATMDGIKSPVAVFCRGQIDAAALALAAHGRKGLRSTAPDAHFSFQLAEAGDLGSDDGLLASLATALAKGTQQPEAQILEWLKTGVVFSPQQAVQKGLIDAISTEPIVSDSNGHLGVANPVATH